MCTYRYCIDEQESEIYKISLVDNYYLYYLNCCKQEPEIHNSIEVVTVNCIPEIVFLTN